MMGRQHAHLITKLEPESLAAVPFHQSVPGIERRRAAGFPVHLAVHTVDASRVAEDQHVQPHVHDADEVNVLLGDQLRYRVQLGDELYVVESPASIWIPRGMLHAANHLRGTGSFICIILAPTGKLFRPGSE
jgi:hypothetical protein